MLKTTSASGKLGCVRDGEVVSHPPPATRGLCGPDRRQDGKTLLDVVPAPVDDERTIMMSTGQTFGERPAYGPLRDTVVP